MSPPLMVTEDTPPDMLTGRMDLRLVLHNGSRVRMSVDRKTPMMDLLVQVTTAYKISPAGYVLQPYGETGILPYKPSTPIGALDTWTVHIVPKNQALQNPASKISLKQVQQPFEQTFRFQVNLPKNQLYVTRVTGRTTMRDLLYQACSEKGLDPNKYSLRHPKQLDRPLCEEVSIMEYGHNQVSMVSNRMLPSAISSENILAMAAGSGKSSESSSRSLSPESSSGQRTVVQPSRPARKRRPAPKPPAKPAPQPPNTQKKDAPKNRPSNEPVICHSRTSSDSSGYHEASVLSESPDSNNSSFPDSLPRRSKLPSNAEPKPNNKLSRSLSNLHHESTVPQTSMKPAHSTSCLAPSRKKKPAPAPPVLAITEEEREDSTMLARSSHTLPPNARLSELDPSSVDAPPSFPAPLHTSPQSSRLPSPESSVVPSVDQPKGLKIDEEPSAQPFPNSCSRDAENERVEEEIERMFEEATREHVSLESGVDVGESSPGVPSPDVSSLPSPDLIPDPTPEPELSRILDSPIEASQADDPFNWEYKLPAPPTFRDIVDREATSSPILTTYSTMTVGNIKDVLYQPSLVDDRPDLPKIIGATERNVEVVQELAAVVGSGASILSAPKEQTDTHPKPRIVSDKLDNFRITTYSSKNQSEEASEEKSSRKRFDTNSAQRATDWPSKDPKPVERRAHLSGGVKRSLSHVSHLAKARFNISNSTSDLRSAELSGDPPDLLRDGPLYHAMRPTSGLRKTSSEISINIDLSENKDEEDENHLPNGLQSLNVLRRIMPQLSRSNGALNKIEHSNSKNSQANEDQGFIRPNISLSTWGERPKRQVSIKYDRDYVFGGMKSAQPNSLNGLAKPPTAPVKSAVSEKPSNAGTATSPGHKGPKTLAYKMLETGNTKPLKQILEREKNYNDIPETTNTRWLEHNIGIDSLSLPTVKPPVEVRSDFPKRVEKESRLQFTGDNSVQPAKEATSLDNLHVPIVRGVELKKPYRMESDNRMVKEPAVPPAEFLVVREFLKSRDDVQHQKEPQPRPVSSYLFGYEPKVKVPTPPAPPPPLPKKFNSVVDLSKVTLKPVNAAGSRQKLRQREVDPREELMASIRSFGKSNLRKVSAR